MSIYENLTDFAGKPVEDWLPDSTAFDPSAIHYRLRVDYDDMENSRLWVDRFAAHLSQPNVEQTSGLVVGVWGASWAEGKANTADEVVSALVSARDKLPHLKALFLGDIVSEENEISWIEQADISPLFQAYPNLEILAVRGGNRLRLGRVQHHRLKRFIIQSGGLSREIAQDAIMADFPALEHLELWLGDANYGANTTPEDFSPLLNSERFPALTYLGLRDSQIIDDLAGVLANAPLLTRLHTLDISLGNLSDVGAAALVKSPLITHLKKLDVHHHYCSEEMIAQLKKLPIEVDASDPKQEDQWGDERWRFIAVSE
jgi:hypothetical protein